MHIPLHSAPEIPNILCFNPKSLQPLKTGQQLRIELLGKVRAKSIIAPKGSDPKMSAKSNCKHLNNPVLFFPNTPNDCLASRAAVAVFICLIKLKRICSAAVDGCFCVLLETGSGSGLHSML